MPASPVHNSPQTWLTFAACGGLFDWKMTNFLVDNKIKSSIFVTSLWMNKNHHAAVLSSVPVYKFKTVADEAGLNDEVFTAQRDIENNFGQTPHCMTYQLQDIQYL